MNMLIAGFAGVVDAFAACAVLVVDTTVAAAAAAAFAAAGDAAAAAAMDPSVFEEVGVAGAFRDISGLIFASC